jgi:hypothetical protein
MDMFPDHSKWNFLDKKHMVNKDCLPKTIRAGPLTGYVDTIEVSGTFLLLFQAVLQSWQALPTTSLNKMAMLASLLHLSRC